MASSGVPRGTGVGRTEERAGGEDVRSPHAPELAGHCVVAYVTAADQHAEVRRAAADHARSHGCVLILYAADAASWFGEPLPSGWSADGERELYGERLGIDDLHTLGRPEVAAQVAAASRGGVRAGGWLPKDHGLGALAAYAVDQHAHLVFVPAIFEAIDELSARLAGAPDAVSELREPALRVVVVQPDDGAQTRVRGWAKPDRGRAAYANRGDAWRWLMPRCSGQRCVGPLCAVTRRAAPPQMPCS